MSNPDPSLIELTLIASIGTHPLTIQTMGDGRIKAVSDQTYEMWDDELEKSVLYGPIISWEGTSQDWSDVVVDWAVRLARQSAAAKGEEKIVYSSGRVGYTTPDPITWAILDECDPGVVST